MTSENNGPPDTGKDEDKDKAKVDVENEGKVEDGKKSKDKKDKTKDSKKNKEDKKDSKNSKEDKKDSKKGKKDVVVIIPPDDSRESMTSRISTTSGSESVSGRSRSSRSMSVSRRRMRQSVHELEPIQSLYLDKHQRLAVVSLAVGGILVVASAMFMVDWRQRHTQCHFNMISFDPPVITWALTHECRFANELDKWILTVSVAIAVGSIQMATFALAVYAEWKYWCQVNAVCAAIGVIGALIGFWSDVFNLPIPATHYMLKLRAKIFYLMFLLDLIFLPIVTWIVYWWTLFHTSR